MGHKIKNNYSAWLIDLTTFDTLSSAEERLRFLLRFGLLAPSSHNTQPWSFRLEGQKIIIEPAWCRALPESDKNNRQLYTSLGCALKNILVAADYYGYETNYHFRSSTSGTVIEIDLDRQAGESSRPTEHLIHQIAIRTANRNRYEPKQSLPVGFVDWLGKLAPTGFRLDLITDQLLRWKIADNVLRAGIEAMEDTAFRRELSGYVRNNLTRKFTGMPCFGMGIPAVPSLFAPTAIRFLNMNRLSRRSDEILVKNYTPAFIVISSQQDRPEDWIMTGLLFETIALEAGACGLSTAPMAGVVQIGHHHRDLQEILGQTFRPQFFCRIGYTDSVPRHSPRLPLEQVVTSP